MIRIIKSAEILIMIVGGAGIWLGLLAGVGCASLLLMRRFWRRGLDRTLIVPAPPTGRPGD